MKLAFYKSKKHLFNRLVSWWTKGPYSHCEIILDEGAVCHTGSSSYLEGGVRTKFMPLPDDTWDIVEISGDIAFAKQWFEDHAGEPYDVLGLFGFLGRRGQQDQSKWFCTEAVAAALQMNEPWRYDANTLHALFTGSQHPATLPQ